MATFRRCQACGTTNLADAEYCASCGVAIEIVGAARTWLATLATTGGGSVTAISADSAAIHQPELAMQATTLTPPPAVAAAPPTGIPAPQISSLPTAVMTATPQRRNLTWLAPTIAVVIVLALTGVLVGNRPGSQQSKVALDLFPRTTAAPVTSAFATESPTTEPIDAATGLALLAGADHDRVLSLQGKWVPQLGAKQDGTEWEGIVYDLPAILQLHRKLGEQVDGALLIEGSTLAFLIDGEPMAGWWITVADHNFDDPEGALAWCSEAGFDRWNCAARYLTDDKTATSTLRFQST